MTKRYVTRYSLCAFVLFLLSVFIVACGSSTASTPPKPTATTPPTATPSPAASLTVYKGTGYSIGYPHGWTLNGNNPQAIQVLDPAQDNLVVVSKVSQNLSNSSNAPMVRILLGALKIGATDYKVINVPSQTTINGTLWNQGAATMTDPKIGPMQVIVLATQNPKHAGQMIAMFYGAALKNFDKINSEDFQPMLKSFQFQA